MSTIYSFNQFLVMEHPDHLTVITLLLLNVIENAVLERAFNFRLTFLHNDVTSHKNVNYALF